MLGGLLGMSLGYEVLGNWALTLGFMLSGLAWVLLGYALWSDVPFVPTISETDLM